MRDPKTGLPVGGGIIYGKNNVFPKRDYQGSLSNGQMHGYGTMHWQDFNNDGELKAKWHNVNYEGEFKADKHDGLGFITINRDSNENPNGEKQYIYNGMWEDDL